MKKKLFLMVLIGGALAGCVNEEVADVLPNQEQTEAAKIVFDSPVTYNNVAESRAKVFGEIVSYQYGTSTYTYPQEEDFQIFAVQHTGDFEGWADATNAEFNDRSISYDNQLDGWVPLKDGNGFYYWPDANTTKMSFAACSPADLGVAGATRSYGATGLTITNFEVAADASKQYDLLYSRRVLNKTSVDMNHEAGKYSGIPIQFQHALSSIRFSLLNESSEELILKKIIVYGVKYKGNFNEGINETNSTDYITEGTNKNVTPTWTPTNDVISEENAYLAFEGSVVFPTGNAQYVADLAAADVDEVNENEKCNVLLLLPQDLTDDIKIRIEYTVNGNAASKIVEVTGAKNSRDDSIINKWEIGTRYVYRLYYSQESSDKDKIYFAPSTGIWNEGGAYIIELL